MGIESIGQNNAQTALTRTAPHQHSGRNHRGRRAASAAQVPEAPAKPTTMSDPNAAKLVRPETPSQTAPRVKNATARLMGDMNGDGKVDQNDVDAFVLAISDREAYVKQYGEENYRNGDFRGTGTITFDDIGAFRKALSQSGITA